MSVFHFKQFSVRQDHGVMPLTLDPILLANFIQCQGEGLALDIGTGTGIIPLILAQRAPLIRMIGIDISSAAVKNAGKNFKDSPFRSRLEVIESDFFHFTYERPFDLICSNPPFYRNGIHSKDEHLARAKHDSNFSWPKFFKKAAELSHDKTRLYLIFPEQNWNSLRMDAVSNGWYVRRWRRFHRSDHTPDPIRLLVEWERGNNSKALKDQYIDFPKPENILSSKLISEESRDLYIWQ